MKALNWFNTRLVYKLILGVLILFFIFLGWRQEIIPSFLIHIIPLNILDIIIYPVILMLFITLVFMLANLARYLKKEKQETKDSDTICWKYFPFKSIICFLASIALIIVLSNLMELSARDRVKSFLDNVSSDVIVSINERSVADPNKVIAELMKTTSIEPHGSHAEKIIQIEVKDHNKTLILELGRDSSNYQEYWVFYPKYRYTSRNEIGRIVTNLFDDY